MPMYPIPNVPDSLAREIYADLLNYLPLPPTDTPEARLLRDSRAMAAVAALIPENAAEAAVAITAIATDFHAKDALAAASKPNLTIDALKNLRGMTASMSRQSQNAIRTLRLMQAERRKLEDALYPAAMERSGHWFKDASLMVAGPSPVAIPPPTEPTGELPRRALARMDAAEQFAARHPSRAAAIRAHGGVPPDCDFSPPDPKLVAFILASRSPLLLELDQPSPTLPLPLREGAGGGGAANPNNPNNPTTSTTVSQTNTLRRG